MLYFRHGYLLHQGEHDCLGILHGDVEDTVVTNLDGAVLAWVAAGDPDSLAKARVLVGVPSEGDIRLDIAARGGEPLDLPLGTGEGGADGEAVEIGRPRRGGGGVVLVHVEDGDAVQLPAGVGGVGGLVGARPERNLCDRGGIAGSQELGGSQLSVVWGHGGGGGTERPGRVRRSVGF